MSINNQSRAKASDWPHYKRLLELCYAGSGFIEKFLSKPEETLKESGLILDAATAKEAIEVQTGRRNQREGLPENYYMSLTRKIIRNVHADIADRYDVGKLESPDFKAWFQRQQNRILFESYLNRRNIKNFYIPVSFELTKGCSMGCPFCCLDAGKLTGSYRYSRENAGLWEKILESTKKIIGQAAGSGVCYFATEPLDNPDYEKFIMDFYRIFGYYPQTTTAKAAENPNRTKKLLSMLGETHLRCGAVRFSVISKNQLEKIHRIFSPEELACVELLLNNPESLYSYSLTGRAADLKERLPEKNFAATASTICTIGFVVNMVTQTVMLTAPRAADERYPMGMKVYETVSFTEEASYEEALYQMMERWMKTEIPWNEKMKTGTYTTYERKGNYLRMQGDKIHRTFSMEEGCYRCFVQMAEEGATLKEVLDNNQLSAFERQRIAAGMQAIYDAGYIDIV